MIDLRAVRATKGAEVTDLSTDEGCRTNLGDNTLATSWSQSDVELIITIPELLASTHILNCLSMAQLHLPARQLSSNKTLRDYLGLQQHKSQIAEMFDLCMH